MNVQLDTLTKTISPLAAKFGFVEFSISPVIVGRDVSWYVVEEEKELGDGGDLYFKKLFVAVNRSGGLYSYASGIEIWGRSIASEEYYNLYPTGSRAFVRLNLASDILCHDADEKLRFAMTDITLEMSNEHHVIFLVDALELPSSPADVFDNNESYVEFLGVVKASYLSRRGRVVMVLDDPAFIFAYGGIDRVNELQEEVPGMCLLGIRCELL